MTTPRSWPTPPELASSALLLGLQARATSGRTRDVLDAALKLVVTMCQAVIGNADGVSITLPRDGHFGTIVASNATVRAMDDDQYDTGQGPCLDAAQHGERFFIDELAQERRWSQFIPRAQARGIESILSSPLLEAGVAHGALNIYARRAGAFAVHEKQWADDFAQQASSVLTAARQVLPSEQLDGHLQQALASRAVIARAQGWVMHRDGITADSAWARLVEGSADTNRPLLDVCQQLLDEGGASRGAARPEALA